MIKKPSPKDTELMYLNIINTLGLCCPSIGCNTQCLKAESILTKILEQDMDVHYPKHLYSTWPSPRYRSQTRKRNKIYIHIERENVKLSFYADDMKLYRKF